MNKIKKKTCIIHYHGFDSYSEIKSVSSANEDHIRGAKLKREELQGENYRQVQCESILESISNDHGIHMTPCYKKFTLILARCDNKESGETRSSKRNSNGNNTTVWIYPNICNICKKGSVKFQGKKAFPITITTEATESIKEAAKTNDPELYAKIKHIDLITKEFKYQNTVEGILQGKENARKTKSL